MGSHAQEALFGDPSDEITADGSGFGVDADKATLREKVVLAPLLELQREAIVAAPIAPSLLAV